MRERERRRKQNMPLSEGARGSATTRAIVT